MKNTPDEITNSEDILDSRNIQKRYDYLTGRIQDAFSDAGRDSVDFESCGEKWEEGGRLDSILGRLVKMELLDESELEEWKTIKTVFIDQFSNNSGWQYGMGFLRDSYMDEDWVENECKDLGYLSSMNNELPSFIYNNINGQGILEDLQQDYTTVDFDGVDYWYRQC